MHGSISTRCSYSVSLSIDDPSTIASAASLHFPVLFSFGCLTIILFLKKLDLNLINKKKFQITLTLYLNGSDSCFNSETLTFENNLTTWRTESG